MPSKYAELFQELGQPMPESVVKWRKQGGRDLAYITARTVMNRLDVVLGPENWWTEFFPHGQHGVLCKLSVRLPDGGVISKCDVGGYAGMADGGDDEKSAASDALKRAAVLFGVGRELYGDGNTVSDLVPLTEKVASRLPSGPSATVSARPERALSSGVAPAWPTPAPNVPAQVQARPDPAPTVDGMMAQGYLKRGLGPPPQRDNSPPADLLDGDDSYPDDFLRYIRGKCDFFNKKLRDDCGKRALNAPAEAIFTPEKLAIRYCDRASRDGGVDHAEVTDSEGRFDPARCLAAVEDHYSMDPWATDLRIQADVDILYGAAIGNCERDAYAAQNGGKAPNRVGPADTGAPRAPQGGGHGAPRTGRALFAWVKEQEQKHEVQLLKYLQNWGKLQEFPGRMVDYNAEHTELAYREAVRKLQDSKSDGSDSYEEALAN